MDAREKAAEAMRMLPQPRSHEDLIGAETTNSALVAIAWGILAVEAQLRNVAAAIRESRGGFL